MNNENNLQDLLKMYDKKLQFLQHKMQKHDEDDFVKEINKIKQDIQEVNHSISLLHRQIQTQAQNYDCDLSLKAVNIKAEEENMKNFFSQIGVKYDSNKYDVYNKYNKAFNNYIKRSMDRCGANLSNEDREVLMMGAVGDGYALPGNYYTKLINKMHKYSALRPYASRMFTTQEEIQIPSLPSTEAHWLTDAAISIEDKATTARTVKMNYQYVNFNISQKLLDDNNFPVMDWMLDKICDNLARGEDKAMSIGSTNSFMRAMMNSDKTEEITSHTSPLTTVDNLGFVTSETRNVITIEDLLKLVYSLPGYHLKSAAFIMNRNTMSAIRKLQDKNNNYIWKFSDMTCNNIDTLLGYPVIFVPHLTDIKTNNIPVAFGSLKDAYQMLDGKVRLIKDPYSKKPWVSFYVAKQIGGTVMDNNALRLLKIK